MISFKTGIAICTYNRGHQIAEVVDSVMASKPNDTRVIVCDDGSSDNTHHSLRTFPSVTFISGPNMGVGVNKNRALYMLRNCDFITILEDDLLPTEKGWFEMYIEFCLQTNIHHFCRVQDRRVEETVPDFTKWCVEKLKMTPIYGPSPRGDFTFISNMVVRKVGAFHPDFKGVGHAHGQWSDRVFASGLIGHPNKWVDIQEASVLFRQLGDTVGGRWTVDPAVIKDQIKRNSELRKSLIEDGRFTYIEPFLP